MRPDRQRRRRDQCHCRRWARASPDEIGNDVVDRKTVTGLVHSVETTYEPHRNLITSVTNQAIAPNFNLNLIPNLNLQPRTKNQERFFPPTSTPATGRLW